MQECFLVKEKSTLSLHFLRFANNSGSLCIVQKRHSICYEHWPCPIYPIFTILCIISLVNIFCLCYIITNCLMSESLLPFSRSKRGTTIAQIMHQIPDGWDFWKWSTFNCFATIQNFKVLIVQMKSSLEDIIKNELIWEHLDWTIRKKCFN